MRALTFIPTKFVYPHRSSNLNFSEALPFYLRKMSLKSEKKEALFGVYVYIIHIIAKRKLSNAGYFRTCNEKNEIGNKIY